jgi:hypothetical protein
VDKAASHLLNKPTLVNRDPEDNELVKLRTRLRAGLFDDDAAQGLFRKLAWFIEQMAGCLVHWLGRQRRMRFE